MAIFCFWKIYKVFSLSLSFSSTLLLIWVIDDRWLIVFTGNVSAKLVLYREIGKKRFEKEDIMQNEKIPRMKAEPKENSPKKAHTLLTCFIRETTCIKRRRLEMLNEWTNRARSMPYCMLGVLLYTWFFLIARTPTHGIVPLSTHFYCTLCTVQ